METMENAERQREALDNCPSQKTVEVLLDGISLDFLSLKRVDNPHGDVANQQKSDHLTAGFSAIVFGKMNSATWNVGDEEQLKNHLKKSAPLLSNMKQSECQKTQRKIYT